MSITVDAKDFEELKPLDPCILPAVIGKAEYNAAKEEGKFPYYAVPFLYEDSEGRQRVTTRNFSLSPKSKPFIARLLKAVGMVPEGDAAVQFEFDDLEGEQVKVALGIRKWTDESGEEHVNNEVTKILPPR